MSKSDASGPRSRAPHGAADASPPPASIAIAELRDLLSKATPGPWEYVPSDQHHGPYITTGADLTYGDIADCYVMSRPNDLSTLNGGPSRPIPMQGDKADANAALIAAAKNSMGALLDAYEERERLRTALQSMISAWEGKSGMGTLYEMRRAIYDAREALKEPSNA